MVQSEENVDHLWVMAAYALVAGLRQKLPRQAVQEATDALMIPTKISKGFESALRNFDSILGIVDTTTAQSKKSPSRSLVGMALRSWGATWSTQVTYVLLAQAVYAPQNSTEPETSVPGVSMDEFLERFSAFADFVWDQDLRDAHLQRPLLNGNEIQVLFGLQKGGKYLKTVLDELIAWQFEHNDGQVEDTKQWLLGQQKRLGIPVES